MNGRPVAASWARAQPTAASASLGCSLTQAVLNSAPPRPTAVTVTPSWQAWIPRSPACSARTATAATKCATSRSGAIKPASLPCGRGATRRRRDSTWAPASKVGTRLWARLWARRSDSRGDSATEHQGRYVIAEAPARLLVTADPNPSRRWDRFPAVSAPWLRMDQAVDGLC